MTWRNAQSTILSKKSKTHTETQYNENLKNRKIQLLSAGYLSRWGY